MPRQHDGPFDRIANFRSPRRAAPRAARGKRAKPGTAAFLADLEPEIPRLERAPRDGSYRPGAHVKIELFDPKRRIVSAAPFRDRVAHQALCAVIAPIHEAGFIDHRYANRIGKGTHRAVETYERYRDRHRHVPRTDIFRYFPAIDHAILKADLRRRLACARTLALAADGLSVTVVGDAAGGPLTFKVAREALSDRSMSQPLSQLSMAPSPTPITRPERWRAS